MANTTLPWGPNAPLNISLGVESTFGTYTAAERFIRHTGVPDLSGLHLRMFPDPSMKGDLNVVHPHIPGATGALPADAAFTLACNLFGLQTDTPNSTDMAGHATDATGHVLALLFDAFFGAESAIDKYTTLTTAAHTVDLLTVAATAEDFALGGAFVVDTQTTTPGPLGTAQYEVGFAKTINPAATNTIVPRVSMARAASAVGGQTIAGGLTYYPANVSSKTLSMLIAGPLVDTTTPIYCKLTGIGVATCEISGKAGEIPTVSFGLRPTTQAWTDASAVGASVQAWAYPQAEQLAGGRWTIGGTAAAVESFALTLSRGLVEIPSLAGVCGRAGWVATGDAAGIGTLKLDIVSNETLAQTIRTAYRAQSTLSIQGWGGTVPGRMWATAVPAAHIDSLAEVESGGRWQQTLTLRPQVYTGDTGASVEIGDKSLYFALL